MKQKDVLAFIRSVLAEHLSPENHTAFLFGSRAQGSAQKYSDYDIGIEGEKIDDVALFEINEKLEESDLPYIVEIVDFNNVSEDFKKEAKQHTITINL